MVLIIADGKVICVKQNFPVLVTWHTPAGAQCHGRGVVLTLKAVKVVSDELAGVIVPVGIILVVGNSVFEYGTGIIPRMRI